VALSGTKISKERIASIIRVIRISELGTKLVVTSAVPSSLIRFTLIMKAIHISKTSLLTRATRRHITEHGILHKYLSAESQREHKNKFSMLFTLLTPLSESCQRMKPGLENRMIRNQVSLCCSSLGAVSQSKRKIDIAGATLLCVETEYFVTVCTFAIW
jgi:hypothetical protein